jgi:hypothetical protein
LVFGYKVSPKGMLSPSVTYFAWKSFNIKNGTVNDSFYGPSFGGFNRKRIALPNSPISFVYCIYMHAGYLFYKKPAGYSSTSSPFGISYGAETGLGMQLDKVGLYAMVTYDAEGLWVLDSSSIGSDNMANYLMRGIQIKIGYNFDLPTLFK